jgi:hypothetical protein
VAKSCKLENFLALEVGGCRLGRVNLCHWAGQHVLIEKQEVGIFASLDIWCESTKKISNS